MRKTLWIVVGLTILAWCGAGCAHQKKVSAQDQKSAQAYYLLAVAYLNGGDATSALEELLKAEKLNPYDSEIQNSLGLVYYAKEKYGAAIGHLERAIQLDPKNSDAHHNLGTIYLYQGRHDQAIAEFESALANDLYRNRAQSLNSLGYTYYKKRDFLKAEKYLLDCLEHDHMYLLAYDNLAKVYISLERYDDAKVQLERVLKLKEFYPEAMLDLGLVYLNTGQKAKAKELFQKVLRIDPLGQYGQRAQEYLGLLE